MCSVYFVVDKTKVGQEALESSSAVLQTAAKPSQLPARKNKKRPGVTNDTGPFLEGSQKMSLWGRIVLTERIPT